MSAGEIAIFTPVAIVAVIFNGVLRFYGSNRPDLYRSPFGIITFLLFTATIYLGWRFWSWFGLIAATLVLGIGMYIVYVLLRSKVRTTSLPT